MTTKPTISLSIDDLPRNLSRPARAALFAMRLKCDSQTGEVEAHDGMTPQQRIAKWCGWDDRQTRDVIAELEAARLVKRVGRTRGQSLFLLVLRQKSAGICEVCTAPVAKLDGARRCAAHLQFQRREWKADVLEIWRKGKLAGRSDSWIVQACYTTVRRKDGDGVLHVIPRWGRVDDTQGSGSGGASEGLIPAMVDMGILPAEWLKLCELARAGGEVDG